MSRSAILGHQDAWRREVGDRGSTSTSDGGVMESLRARPGAGLGSRSGSGKPNGEGLDAYQMPGTNLHRTRER